MQKLPWVSLMLLLLISRLSGANSFQILNTASETGSPTATLRAVSADGTTVVGTGFLPYLSSSTAYRWSNGVTAWLLALPGTGFSSSRAFAVSANGSVVVGSSTRSSIEQAVRWVNGATMPVALGLPAGWTGSTAFGVSDDGLVIAGIVRNTINGQTVRQPFRWTSGTGVQVLALPTNTVTGTNLVDETVFLSADGNVLIAKVSIIASTNVTSVAPYRWVGAGDLEALETPAGATSVSITGLSADGMTVIGTVANGACKWDGTTLHPLFGSGISSGSVAISSDGSKILVTSNGVAVRWSGSGVDILGSFSPRAMSADGNIVAGLKTSALRSEAIVWDAFNGARSLTDLFLHSFTNTQIARYRITTVVAVRNVGGKITLAGNATGVVNPYRGNVISDGWVGTFPTATDVEPNPFDGPLFDKTAALTPTLSLSETFRHSLVSFRSDGLPVVSPLARFATRLTGTVSMDGVDLAALDANTPVQLVFGCIAFSAKLGDDPSYSPGKSAATLYVPYPALLKLAWTSKALSVSLSSSVSETTGDYSPYFDPLKTTSVTVPMLMSRSSPGSGYMNLELNFAGRKGRRPIFISWTAARNSVTREVGESYQSFWLNNLVVNGQADYVAPTLKFIAPVAKAVLPAPSIPVAISVNDAGVIALVLVKLNDGDFLPATLDNFGNVAAWMRTVTPLPGLNTLRAKAIDFSGNESQVVSNSFVYLYKGGSYSGLLTGEAGAPRGFFTLTLTESGAFSGKATLNGKALSFRGTLTESGTAEVILGDIVLNFALALDGTGNILTGALTRGTEVLARIDAARMLFDGKSTRSPRQGSYTLLFPSSGTTNTPTGHGYAKLVVAANGVGKILGKLADGTAFTAAAAVDGREQFPLFVKLYGAGVMAGPLHFREQSLSDLDGTLRWVKPEQKSGFFKPGFSVDLNAVGSVLGGLDYYVFLPRDEQTQANARLRFSGGNLVTSIDQQVTASGTLYRLPSSPTSFTLKSTADGLFTGSFLDTSSSKVRRFRGSILTKPQTAAGFFLGDQTGGAVELIPGFQ